MSDDSWTRFPPLGGSLLLPTDGRETAAAAVALEASRYPRALRARDAATRWILRAGTGTLPGRRVRWAPPLPRDEWEALLAGVREAVGLFTSVAVWERRIDEPRGFALRVGGRAGEAAFVKVRPEPAPGLARERDLLRLADVESPRAFHLPALLGHGGGGAWSWIALSVVPPLHGPPGHPRIAVVTADVGHLLRDLPRPAATPAHWEPMHGDLTPWNLRQGADGRLWLYDWERAGYGPPGADAVLYHATAAALHGEPGWQALSAAGAWPEAAAYWAERVAARPARTRGERRLRRDILHLLGADAPAEPAPAS